MLINIDCNKRVIKMIRKLSKDVEALQIAADERFVPVTAGKPNGHFRPFSDQQFRFQNITNIKIWYDVNLCVAGIQAQYGQDFAPYHGANTIPAGETSMTIPSPIQRAQGTVGSILDSI